MDPTFVQVLGYLFGAGGLSAVALQIASMLREHRRGTPAPLSDAAARLDIARQLELERTARAAAEHERDDANARAAAEGRERTAADRRAEAADRRANAEQRARRIADQYAGELREDCIAHGTPRHLLRPRPVTDLQPQP